MAYQSAYDVLSLLCVFYSLRNIHRNDIHVSFGVVVQVKAQYVGGILVVCDAKFSFHSINKCFDNFVARSGEDHVVNCGRHEEFVFRSAINV